MTTVAAKFCTSKDTKALSLPTPRTGSRSLQLSPSACPCGDPPGVGIQVEW